MDRAGGGAAPVGVRRAAGADAGDDVDVEVVVAPVAAAVVVVVVVVVVVDVVVVVGALAVLAVVPAVAVPAVAVPAVAVPADVAAAVGAESMMYKATGEGWVQQVSIVLLVVEVVVAAVADDDCETAWLATMRCASGRTVAADSVHGFFAKFGKAAARMAGESQIELVATSMIGVVSRATDVAFDLVEARRTDFV